MGNKQTKEKVTTLEQELNEVDADGDIPAIKISEFSPKGEGYLQKLVPAARGKRVKEVSISKSIISPSLLLVLSELVVMKRVLITASPSLDANCRGSLGRWLSDLPSDREICLITKSLNEDLLLQNLLEASCHLKFRPLYPGSVKQSRMTLLKLGKIIMVGNLCELELGANLLHNKRQERILLNSLEKATTSLKRFNLGNIDVAGTWRIGEYQWNNEFMLGLKDLCRRDVAILLGLEMSSTVQSVDICFKLSQTERNAHLVAVLLERSSVQRFEIPNRGNGECVTTPAVSLAIRLWNQVMTFDDSELSTYSSLL